ncbi:hypothetical protein A2954_05855 [Candidatus Roizmanbacteria bacterium RIFCSPLOWO2_01_FULL_37_12]|uniref:Glycosyl transferase family 1 domain-containing protein n=1 Tax=Candidatus Roizmanbacteria bacterium RIFCSPLOWO2_01_FULL_37_12 TaxID=1802056 RepID=A0A1F7IBV6_9BACT|nr:MAG: hypothetical protein A2768_02595 [Candidatus Roizmanbacteria bacterium RIFCSPHIGHO2_01_FULL_37_16]OGK25993.1 MAG: hypothetical protein A3D76_03470 [Candidatus Roizmanbacteria bacterium RIFCSPHIGHO2_02_FULL_37_9b]OGK40830.1 MAG: hypothetical protein A2954_05855 [Candidatus Roizmanbacteria bacterium RIFCSPLOWO2_01_FULL_37_12]
MHRIGIDARLYGQTGVGVYLRNLLYFLEKSPQNNLEFYIYFLPNEFRKLNFENKNFVKKLVSSPWHSFSEQTLLLNALYKDDLDLMHFTYFSYPVLYKRKFIATIHDTTPLLYKTGKASTKNPLLYEIKFQAFKFVMSQQVKNAGLIITPSKTVKKQLISIYGNKYEDKIKHIYEGVNFELLESSKKILISKSQFLNKFQISTNQIPISKNNQFFIYIGNFYPHKNVENLIKAFSKIKEKVNLILIGPDDYFANRLSRNIGITKRDQIIFYHSPSKEDLVFFYKNALALIHPSLSEGFGLPLVEAAYFKLPIIASNIAVFKEVLGNKYISFRPEDPDDIANKIKSFLKGRKKIGYTDILKKFSFEKMANNTLDLYNQELV